MRRILPFLAISLCLAGFAAADPAAIDATGAFFGSPGQWKWSVHYGPLHLGDLVIDAPSAAAAQAGALSVRLRIDSAPGLRIVDMHNTFDTSMDPPTLSPLTFLNQSQWGNEVESSVYTFDGSSGSVSYALSLKKGKKETKMGGKISPIDGLYDGVSLVVRIAALSRGSSAEKVRFVNRDATVPVSIEYTGKRESIPGPGGSPVDAYLVKGSLSGKGVAGLTGAFRVWVSADEKRLPLRAEIQAWIGSVTIDFVPPPAPSPSSR